MGVDNMAAGNLHTKPGVGESLGDHAFDLKSLFFFRHLDSGVGMDLGGTANASQRGGRRPAEGRTSPPHGPRSRLVVGRGHAPARPPPQVGVEEAVDIAVEHALKVADVMARPLVLDPLIRVQEIVTNL